MVQHKDHFYVSSVNRELVGAHHSHLSHPVSQDTRGEQCSDWKHCLGKPDY